MIVTLTSLRAKGDGEVAVTFRLCMGDNHSTDTFVIPASAVIDMKLRVGESTREIYDSVSLREKLHNACRKSAYILGYGTCSKKTLIQKLRRKGVEQEVAEEAALEMERRGFLDDSSGAEREAERSAAKKWGPRRIAAALYQKGYDEETIRSALYSLEDSGVDFVENCAELIRSRYDELPSDPDEKRKLYVAMMRYGYSSSEISSAISMLKDG